MKSPLRGAAAIVVVLTGCAAAGPRGPAIVTPASVEQKAVLWEQLVPLAGRWDYFDDKGGNVGSATFRVIADGSAIQETQFPGEKHEMMNVYHLDGASVVVTHYCAGGNQPRMRATTAGPGVIDFQFESISNLTSPGTSYMGGMKLTIEDRDNMVQEWTSYKDGAAVGSWAFTMRRSKGA